MADKQFAENRVVTINEVAAKTGISRVTLSKVMNQRGYVTGSDVLDRLCRYFGCSLDKLAEYVPDELVPNAGASGGEHQEGPPQGGKG